MHGIKRGTKNFVTGTNQFQWISDDGRLPIHDALQLYRDCLRLVNHIAPGRASPKNAALRATVRSEFRKNRSLTVAEDIENAKASAVRALSNYMLAVSAPKDAKLASSMKDFHGRSVRQAKEEQKSRQSLSKSESSNVETTTR